MRKVMVIGGAGYVGSVLCPMLVNRGFTTVAYDTMWFGHKTLPREVWRIQGDMGDLYSLKRAMAGCDAVIHLACISNDPSFDLNPEIGRRINWETFPGICEAVREMGVKQFIYASSSSVYGVKSGNVTEEFECDPLTDYSKYKLACEKHLQNADMGKTTWTILRPATVCGYSPRLRLDLIINALTISALATDKITVHGGKQLRPNIHIKDMASAYIAILDAASEAIHRQIFNVGTSNASVAELAYMVEEALGFPPQIKTEFTSTNDNRSYQIDSDKIYRLVGFKPAYGLDQAVKELAVRFSTGQIKNPLTDPIYYNVKRMKEVFR